MGLNFKKKQTPDQQIAQAADVTAMSVAEAVEGLNLPPATPPTPVAPPPPPKQVTPEQIQKAISQTPPGIPSTPPMTAPPVASTPPAPPSVGRPKKQAPVVAPVTTPIKQGNDEEIFERISKLEDNLASFQALVVEELKRINLSIQQYGDVSRNLFNTLSDTVVSKVETTGQILLEQIQNIATLPGQPKQKPIPQYYLEACESFLKNRQVIPGKVSFLDLATAWVPYFNTTERAKDPNLPEITAEDLRLIFKKLGAYSEADDCVLPL